MLNKIRDMRRTMEEKKILLRQCDDQAKREQLKREIFDLDMKLTDMRKESGYKLNPEDGPLPTAMAMLHDDLTNLLDMENNYTHERNLKEAEVFVRDLLYKISDISGGFVDDWGHYPETWTIGLEDSLLWHIYGSINDVLVQFTPTGAKGSKRPYITAHMYR